MTSGAEPIAIAVAGAGGRMGRTVLKAAQADAAYRIAAAFDRPDAEVAGVDTGALIGAAPLGVAVASTWTPTPGDILIDFTAPAASIAHARAAAETGAALVIGSTGFTPEETDEIAKAAAKTAIVKSGNMSLGVNLIAALVEQAAASLGPDFDIEISETHHRRKVDAPSGTALLLGEAAAAGRGVDLAKASVRGRDGIAPPRAAGEIGFASLRGGGVFGDHTVLFASDDEVVEISHRALNRDLFAKGALRAAAWLKAGRAPGLYSMRDVLGL
ncbi:MAG: 4-hydroxy-tetrahydrodipicolinate reductase [Pseudomonadota bacterium]